jgi:hypothetical protein
LPGRGAVLGWKQSFGRKQKGCWHQQVRGGREREKQPPIHTLLPLLLSSGSSPADLLPPLQQIPSGSSSPSSSPTAPPPLQQLLILLLSSSSSSQRKCKEDGCYMGSTTSSNYKVCMPVCLVAYQPNSTLFCCLELSKASALPYALSLRQ